MKLDFETLLDRKHEARLRREDRQLAQAERRDRQAAPFIGELCRDGKTVYYIASVGRYVESDSYSKLVDVLVKRGAIR